MGRDPSCKGAGERSCMPFGEANATMIPLANSVWWGLPPAWILHDHDQVISMRGMGEWIEEPPCPGLNQGIWAAAIGWAVWQNHTVRWWLRWVLNTSGSTGWVVCVLCRWAYIPLPVVWLPSGAIGSGTRGPVCTSPPWWRTLLLRRVHMFFPLTGRPYQFILFVCIHFSNYLMGAYMMFVWYLYI